MGYAKRRTCKNCQTPVSDRGRDSRSGDYFCGADDCRRQRDAERMAAYRSETMFDRAAQQRQETRARLLRHYPQDVVNELFPERPGAPAPN